MQEKGASNVPQEQGRHERCDFDARILDDEQDISKSKKIPCLFLAMMMNLLE